VNGVARLGDGWHPMNCSPDGVRRRLDVVRAEAEHWQREHVLSTVQVRLEMARVTAESSAEYADVGVSELVMSMSTGDVREIENTLETFAAAMF
jgi:alkanesulfonate monooxygenase SsuD/methylene tetrahydromethanopterin reductase-like flavin-dependent oxidoreductase (luciferase family)